MIEIVEKAQLVAHTAHAAVGGLRKYTFEPYIMHPGRVAKRLIEIDPLDYALHAAGWLHDTIEDTELTERFLRNMFNGNTVSKLVMEVTNPSAGSRKPRHIRKKMDLEHLASSSPRGATLKLADMEDNLPSVLQYDPDFAKIYFAEKKLVLEVLEHGDMELFDTVSAIVKEGLRKLP